MTFETMGRILLVAGIGLAVLGLAFILLGKLESLNNNATIGNLPGDFRFETGGLTCLFPLASMLLISAALTIILNLLIRILNR